MDHTTWTILRLLQKQELCGCQIISALENQFDLSFSRQEGMLYPILKAQENDGVLESFYKEGPNERKRRYYRLTGKGRKLLEKEAQQPRSYPRAVTAPPDIGTAPTAGWFDAFCDQVLEHIPRATHAEQEQIREELRGHLEDREERFREQGLENAQDAAIAAMGDAAKIGQAWNNHFPAVWLWAGRLVWTLRVLLVVAVISAFAPHIGGFFAGVRSNVEARLGDLSYVAALETETQLWSKAIDQRMELRDNVVRFHRVRLEQSETADGGYDLILYMVSYAKNPLGETPVSGCLQRITCSTAESPFSYNGETSSLPYAQRRGATYWSERVPIDQTSGTVTITAEHYGQTFTMDVELGGAA